MKNNCIALGGCEASRQSLSFRVMTLVVPNFPNAKQYFFHHCNVLIIWKSYSMNLVGDGRVSVANTHLPCLIISA